MLESLETLLFGSIFGVTRGQVLTLAIVAVRVLASRVAGGRCCSPRSMRGARARRAGAGAVGRVPARAGARGRGDGADHGVLLVFALLVAPAATRAS